MANLITFARFLLVFGVVAVAYWAPPGGQLANPLLVLIVIGLDGLDGFVARRLGESSRLGSVLDIAVDRVVENVLWIVLADLDLVPVWVALVFITRSLIVDSIRGQGIAQGYTAFGMLKGFWGQLLVAGRFMRGLYGTVKALAFAWLLLLQPLPAVYPELWTHWGAVLRVGADMLVYAAVVLCVIRALPVIGELLSAQSTLRRDWQSDTG